MCFKGLVTFFGYLSALFGYFGRSWPRFGAPKPGVGCLHTASLSISRRSLTGLRTRWRGVRSRYPRQRAAEHQTPARPAHQDQAGRYIATPRIEEVPADITFGLSLALTSQMFLDLSRYDLTHTDFHFGCVALVTQRPSVTRCVHAVTAQVDHIFLEHMVGACTNGFVGARRLSPRLQRHRPHGGCRRVTRSRSSSAPR